MAAVREALSIGVLAGLSLVLGIGIWECVPRRRRAREQALRETLFAMRRTIDQYKGDKGRCPQSLDDLVRSGYLRKIPLDPMTGSPATWIEVRSVGCSRARLAGVRSGASGLGLDGTDYRSW